MKNTKQLKKFAMNLNATVLSNSIMVRKRYMDIIENKPEISVKELYDIIEFDKKRKEAQLKEILNVEKNDRREEGEIKP